MELSPEIGAATRPLVFVVLLVLLGAAERWWPARKQDPQRPHRWMANFGLTLAGAVMLMALQLNLVFAAVWAQSAQVGLFHQVTAPAWLEVVLAWVLLDLGIYVQHRAMHEVRWLWPLHRVHHSDVEFDVTTGLRFHPGELLLSQVYKIALIAALGAPWLAVLLFEIGLSSFALLTHANLSLPATIDRRLRWILVTPDMHRIHHSTQRDETDSNYGNLLSVWDRLLRSYRARSRQAPLQMPIGLPLFRHPAHQQFGALLTQPLHREP